jgi:hypothetical protein
LDVSDNRCHIHATKWIAEEKSKGQTGSEKEVDFEVGKALANGSYLGRFGTVSRLDAPA